MTTPQDELSAEDLVALKRHAEKRLHLDPAFHEVAISTGHLLTLIAMVERRDARIKELEERLTHNAVAQEIYCMASERISKLEAQVGEAIEVLEALQNKCPMPFTVISDVSGDLAVFDHLSNTARDYLTRWCGEGNGGG